MFRALTVEVDAKTFSLKQKIVRRPILWLYTFFSRIQSGVIIMVSASNLAFFLQRPFIFLVDVSPFDDLLASYFIFIVIPTKRGTRGTTKELWWCFFLVATEAAWGGCSTCLSHINHATSTMKIIVLGKFFFSHIHIKRYFNRNIYQYRK